MTTVPLSAPLVDIRNLVVSFPGGPAVRGLDLRIARGETVALVGESGSGKTVTARSLVGLAGPDARVSADRFVLDGVDALRFRERDWRALRGRKVGFVLQDALLSLDPLRRVSQLLSDAAGHGQLFRRRASRADSLALLRSVGIRDPERRLPQFPHQLSGGLRQRALIATAVAQGPALVVADEPTTALDATVQKQVLDLLRERRRAGQTLLLISHDLAVVADLADRVIVMKDGEAVEEGPADQVLSAPRHPYTQRLLRAIPSAGSRGFRLAAEAGASREPLPPKRVDRSRPVLQAEHLSKRHAGDGPLAVDDVSFELAAGEALGIVGESGSGKTTLARLVLGLLEPDRGRVRLEGQPWSELPDAGRRPLRAGIQFIAQDALGSFDPRFDVGRIVGESLDAAGLRGTERRRRVEEVLDAVQLGRSVLRRHPRELSGGQRQRVAIARAFAPQPRLLVADEPVSALDVSIQAQILDLLAELQATSGTALLFISHDLGVVRHLTDRVLVMRDGRVVESGTAEAVFARPQHPYTQTLLDAVPTLPGTPGAGRHQRSLEPALERSGT